MKFFEMEKDYTNIRIPEAFRWAVMQEKETEILIYQVVTTCLENLEDVAIKLDRNDNICKFLRVFRERGLFDGNALAYTEDEETCTLSCSFDLYKIREDLDVMSDKVFGTIPMDSIESALLDPCDIEVSENRVDQRQSAIQKVKKVGEISPLIDTKKDN